MERMTRSQYFVLGVYVIIVAVMYLCVPASFWQDALASALSELPDLLWRFLPSIIVVTFAWRIFIVLWLVLLSPDVRRDRERERERTEESRTRHKADCVFCLAEKACPWH